MTHYQITGTIDQNLDPIDTRSKPGPEQAIQQQQSIESKTLPIYVVERWSLMGRKVRQDTGTNETTLTENIMYTSYLHDNLHKRTYPRAVMKALNKAHEESSQLEQDQAD